MSKMSFYQIILTLILFIKLTISSNTCPGLGDLNFFTTTLPKLYQGKYEVFLWNNDWIADQTLNTEVVECFISKQIFNQIGIYLEYNNKSEIAWTYEKYDPAVLEALSKSRKPISLIFNLNINNVTSVQTQISQSFGQIMASSLNVDIVWIRPSIDSDCPEPTSYIDCQYFLSNINEQFLLEAIDFIQDMGYRIGIYSNANAWPLVFGDSDNQFLNYISTFPLMYDGLDNEELMPNYSDFTKFGDFTKPSAKMSQIWYYDTDCCWLAEIQWRNGI